MVSATASKRSRTPLGRRGRIIGTSIIGVERGHPPVDLPSTAANGARERRNRLDLETLNRHASVAAGTSESARPNPIARIVRTAIRARFPPPAPRCNVHTSPPARHIPALPSAIPSPRVSRFHPIAVADQTVRETAMSACDHGHDGSRANCIMLGPVYPPTVYSDGISNELMRAALQYLVAQDQG